MKTAKKAPKSPYEVFIQRLSKHKNYTAYFAGLVFFDLSLFPSLLPRNWLLQGVLSGVAAVIGYFFGKNLARLYKFFIKNKVSVAHLKRLLLAYATIGIPLTVYCMVEAEKWQRDLRDLMGIKGEYQFHLFKVIFGSLLVFIVFRVLNRIFWTIQKFLSTFLKKFVRPSIARPLGTFLVTALVFYVFQGFIFGTIFNQLDQAASLGDRATTEGTVQPSSGMLSGSPESLVPWDSLGKAGRDFTGRSLTSKQISDFSGKTALQPIRLYVGTESAKSLDARAELVLEEIDRTQAFDRKVLVLVTSTGTGWVDPNVIESIELLYGGDTATVSMQYSYLPSWVALLSDKQNVRNAAKTLNDAVIDKWRALPEESRPKLVLFGESLGSYGVEHSFAGIDDLLADIDGALLIGPPNVSPLWRQINEDKDPGSLPYLPIYNEGKNIRFGIEAQDATDLSEPWESPRLLYLQQSSDPVVWWSDDLIFHKPEWLGAVRGPDISKKVKYFPLITYLQTLVDLQFASSMPFGHGHNYGAKAANAWAAIIPPDGWTNADTLKLRSFMDSRQKF